ncbi:MAG TPA: protein-glutamate O-methyltransferase CheR [Rectinemataceae bacterium]|nr:protein-glutamate O-methyltransferase CheR [Rectinemataceae bacterium]
MEGLPEIGESDYRFVARLLYERFGIQLGDRKKILVARRLAKRLRELGFSDFAEYVRLLQADRSGSELVELIDRLTTNHSYFFREKEHFDFLRETVFPTLVRAVSPGHGRGIRIWSAGCAAGEEAHSIAITMREGLGADFSSPDPAILATDISIRALKAASAGNYPESRLGDMPKNYLARYFSKCEEGHYRALGSIHDLILFKHLNLMAIPYPFKGQFDVVFCRNVMIYFDKAAKRSLVLALFDFVKPGGYLFTGHSETLQRGETPFTYLKPGIYRRPAR